MNLTEVAAFATNLARDAGQLFARRRDTTELVTDLKGGVELVTSTDDEVDTFICDALRQRFPAHRILAEESAPDTSELSRSDGPLWIIDPIDGTVNFAHGHYQVAVSIAFAEASRIRFGVVYNPFTDELFSAAEGGGAFLNDQPIRVGSQATLARSLIATGFPYVKTDIETMVRRLREVLLQCADIRRLGSAALDICWVAAGRLDGYYESLSVWDFAAAQLIAMEAGARYGHFQPVPEGVSPAFHDQNILVANPALYPQLEALLQQADSGK